MPEVTPPSTRRRYGVFAYGMLAYVLANASIVYAVGFLANAFVPKSVDSGVTHTVGDPLAVNLALLGVFGLQHSIMARSWFKDRWTRVIPEPMERSTYVLAASLSLVVLMIGWRPLSSVVWDVNGVPAVVLWGVYLGGWLLMLWAVYMIDADDLLGLRQVKAYRDERELTPLEFQTPALYRYIRHPIMTGFLLAFWVTPHMTVGHLLFAGGMTVYILVGVKLEERDLVATYADRYREYRREVPMFIPRPWRKAGPEAD